MSRRVRRIQLDRAAHVGDRVVEAAGTRLHERQAIPPSRVRIPNRRRGGVCVAGGPDDAVRLADHAEAAPSLRVAWIVREAVECLTCRIRHLGRDRSEALHARQRWSGSARGEKQGKPPGEDDHGRGDGQCGSSANGSRGNRL